MKYVIVYRLPMLQVLDHDALEERRRDAGVPHALRINDDDWPVAADAETRRFAAFHSLRAEQQIFPLQELRQQRIDLSPTASRGAKVARAHQHVTRVGLHLWTRCLAHSAKIAAAAQSTLQRLTWLPNVPACPPLHERKPRLI